MSMLPIWKICIKCGKRWDYNPSVNQTSCPYCREKVMKVAKKIMGKNSDDKRKDYH